MSLFVFLFLRELGTCSQKSHAHKRCGALKKTSISTRGYAEIHIQRSIFYLQQKKHIKNSCIENPNSGYML
jgi:hypothetical protein